MGMFFFGNFRALVMKFVCNVCHLWRDTPLSGDDHESESTLSAAASPLSPPPRWCLVARFLRRLTRSRRSCFLVREKIENIWKLSCWGTCGQGWGNLDLLPTHLPPTWTLRPSPTCSHNQHQQGHETPTWPTLPDIQWWFLPVAAPELNFLSPLPPC